MPPRIKLLIADLGLRYRPAAAADLEAHAATIALLAIDLADMPVDRLERAISAWARAEKWLPKASEMIAMCQAEQRAEAQKPTHSADDMEAVSELCAQYNMRDAGKPNFRGKRWVPDGPGAVKIVSEEFLASRRAAV